MQNSGFFFVSQSVISKAIQELEKNFNTKLINRKAFSKEVELTKEGELLLQGIQNINIELDNLKHNLLYFEEKEVLRIGLPFLGDNIQMKKYLGVLLKNDVVKNFKIEIIEDTMVNLHEKLKAEEIDYVFSYYFEKKKSLKNLYSIDFNDMFVSIYGVKSNFDEKEFDDFNIFNNQNLISLKDGTMHAQLIQFFLKRYKIKPKKVIYVENFKLLEKFLTEGYGVTLFASDTFNSNRHICELKLKKEITLKTCIEYTQQKKFLKADQRLIEAMRNFNMRGEL